MTEADRKRLAALLGMLGSDYAGERANAAAAVERFRVGHRLTWADMLAEPVAPPSPVAPPREPPVAAAPPPPQPWVRPAPYRKGPAIPWSIDRGVALVLGGIPLVIVLASFAPMIRAWLGY